MLIVFSVLKKLAQHDSTNVLEQLRVPKGIISLARFLWGKRSGKQPSAGSLAGALTEMGPSFVKLGQALSIRPDLVGKEVASDLRALQDSMAAFSAQKARQTIEETLSKPLNKIFSSFDDVPVAAGSIAQVHKATTYDGATVAVKIIRPGIRDTFHKDIRGLSRYTRAVEYFWPEVRRFQPKGVVAQFAKWSNKELDLRYEAANCTELSRCFADVPWFKPPKIYWDLSGRDILTEEWIDGVRIDDHEKIKNYGLDPKLILSRSIEAFFKQVFEHGFFHGDIHPGNIFVTKDGILRPMDFGIMGHISMSRRHKLADILIGFMTRDYNRVTESLVKMGFLRDIQYREDVTDAMRIVIEPMLNASPQGVSFARILTEIFTLARRFDLQFDSDLMLLNKAMFQAEGTGRLLDDNTNIWVATEPHMETWLAKYRGPIAQIKNAMSALTQVIEESKHKNDLADPVNSVRIKQRLRHQVWLVVGCVLLGALLTLAVQQFAP